MTTIMVIRVGIARSQCCKWYGNKNKLWQCYTKS